MPKSDVVSKILLAFPKINARWLMTGEGDMYVGGIIKN